MPNYYRDFLKVFKLKLNSVSSAVISKMLERRKVTVSGTDLEFLQALSKQQRALNVDELSKKFNLDKSLVISLVKDLKTKELVESNSPRYRASKRGKQLIKLVESIQPEVNKIILGDTYLKILAENSRSIIE